MLLAASLWRAGELACYQRPSPEVPVLPLAEASKGHVMLGESLVIAKAVLIAFRQTPHISPPLLRQIQHPSAY